MPGSGILQETRNPFRYEGIAATGLTGRAQAKGTGAWEQPADQKNSATIRD
jgi:hypothetical protein